MASCRPRKWIALAVAAGLIGTPVGGEAGVRSTAGD